MLDAEMRINDNIDPNWPNVVCDKWFKSCAIISSQSVLQIQLIATMEMGTFHLWGAIELSIPDQF